MESNPAHWYQDALKLSAVITAIATLAYFFTSILLWRTTRAATRLTKEIFEAANRPYIGMHDITHKFEHGYFKISFFVRNSGNVPAYILEGKLQCICSDEVQPSEPLKNIYAFQPDASYPLTIKLQGSKARPKETGYAKIEVRLDCTYKGITNQTYNQKEEYIFDLDLYSFMMISSEGT